VGEIGQVSRQMDGVLFEIQLLKLLPGFPREQEALRDESRPTAPGLPAGGVTADLRVPNPGMA